MTQADEQFIKTCKEIIENGYSSKGTNVRTRWDDGEEANYISIVGVQNKYDVGKEFPMITLRNNSKTIKNAIDEILWIWQKKSNKVSELNSHIWDQWANKEGTIGKAYGYQLGKKYEFKTDVFRAFTSGMIIKKLRERDGIEIDTVDEALKKLYKSGYTDIFCVPTHIMCGIEYDKACRMIEKFNDKMKIRISRPLVTETSDYYNIVDIFKHRLTDKNRLYVFMGHGSDHFANAAYPALDYHFKNADMNNVFVGTVEGFPDLETVISHAMKTDIKNVTLLPFMLVCGDHAKNDMAVEWKEEFENNGFNVECDLTGLGEIKEIQDMYAEHLRNVWGQ